MKELVLALLFLFIAANEAKVYTKCELASILKRNGMDGYYGYKLGNCEFTLLFFSTIASSRFARGIQNGADLSRISSTSLPNESFKCS